MKKPIYYIGLVMSLCLWGLAGWALLVPNQETIHLLIVAAAGITLVAHIGEVAVLLFHPKLKANATAKDALLTLVMGAFHFMPIYKAATR